MEATRTGRWNLESFSFPSFPKILLQLRVNSKSVELSVDMFLLLFPGGLRTERN